ncbi:MAG: 50S ribosomal protein L29 [Candidatus Brocadiae bacterium]|nr:50S ribosomal protein L29 [Candidatus Brocadiia bacterium]
MRAKELRGTDPDELRRELEQLRREIFDLRFQWQAEESPDSSRRRRLRRDIARYMTVLREVQLQQETTAGSTD